MDPRAKSDFEFVKPGSAVGSFKCGSIQLDYELKYLTFHDYCCRKRLTNFINVLKEKNEEYSLHLEILDHEKKRLSHLQMELEELSKQSQRLYRSNKQYLSNNISRAFQTTTSCMVNAASTAKSWFDSVIDFMDFPK